MRKLGCPRVTILWPQWRERLRRPRSRDPPMESRRRAPAMNGGPLGRSVSSFHYHPESARRLEMSMRRFALLMLRNWASLPVSALGMFLIGCGIFHTGGGGLICEHSIRNSAFLAWRGKRILRRPILHFAFRLPSGARGGTGTRAARGTKLIRKTRHLPSGDLFRATRYHAREVTRR